VRRTHPSPLLALAVLSLLSLGQLSRADDDLPVPRVVAQAKGERELLPAPKAEGAQDVAQAAKDEPKGGEAKAKEEPKADAKEAPKEAPKEEPKTSPLDEVKKSVDDLKSSTDSAINDARIAGDSAWMLTASAFVMIMLPGLGLFYGGMVRRKNVLATMMQSMGALAVVGLWWLICGYALAFGAPLIKIGDGGIIGWDSRLFCLQGIQGDTILPGSHVTVYAHVMFQGMFAIITPALISGSLAERIRFWPFCIFMILWVTFVYCPLAHMVWALDWFTAVPEDWTKGAGVSAIGLLGKMGALDFAGGTVVHINAGMAGLACCLILRKRLGYPEQAMHPNSMILTLLGAALLWFGWFGFNGGSAVTSNALSTSAFSATQAAAATAGLTWIFVEWLVKGKPTALGLASGIVAGLVAVTPASGFVYIGGGIFIGIAVGVVCYFAVSLKSIFGFDDSLDAFGVHAVGGFVGAVLTGVFCSVLINSAGANGPFAIASLKARAEALPKLIDDAKKDVDTKVPELQKALKEAQDKVADLEAKVKAAKDDSPEKAKLNDELTDAKKVQTDTEAQIKFYNDALKSVSDEKDKVQGLIDADKKNEKTAMSQPIIQLKAASFAVVFSFVGSLILCVLVHAGTGGNFTTDPQSEIEGLDRTEHGEVGFDYGPGLDTTPAMSAEPRAAKAPPGGVRRFSIVLDGVDNGALLKAWSDLCKPTPEGVAVDPDFKAVYPYVTTVKGNRFQLRGGEPARISAHLERLFQKVLGKQLKARVEE
jgi:Amt family ammonium transporter